MNWINWQPLHDDVDAPTRATAHSAGYDLKAYLKAYQLINIYRQDNSPATHVVDVDRRLTINPGERAMVPLGFKAQLPDFWEAQVRPRSGHAFKVGSVIINSPGTIDADFPNEWMVLVGNDSSVPLRIEHGTKIAQCVLSRYEVATWVKGTVGETTDRQGGFGSTGSK